MRKKIYNYILWIQAVYMFLTALWGLVDINSFMMVTGPKRDVWLVKTVSIILLSISVFLIAEAWRKNLSVTLAIFVLLNSIGLASIDFHYSLNDTISNIYMADGFLQLIFASFWTYFLVAETGRKAG